ncbi:MAG: hypothetical protein ABIV06_14645 [Thermoanaerobaculia bacterium]
MSYRTTLAVLLTLATATVTSAQTKPADSTIMNNSLQVTGSVVTSEANRLVVKKDNGQEMVFIITDKQVDASLFHPGDRVTASYTTLAGTGAVVSKVVAVPAETTTQVTQYTPPATATQVTTTTAPAPAMPTTTTTRTTVAPVATTTSTEPATTLPSTASPMPLVALLGLLGAAGAATIRRFRLS